MKALTLLLIGALFSFSVTAQCTANWLNITAASNIPAGDGINIGNVVVTGTQLTVEATFSRSSATTSTGTPSVDLVSRHTGMYDCNFLLRVDHAEITTGVSPSTNFVFTDADTVCPMQQNVVYNVAMTYDGAFLRFYRNGTLISSKACTGNMNTTTLMPTRIGTEEVTSFFNPTLLGYINHVRIWNVVRTQAQLQATMGLPLASPSTTPNLLACYDFNSLTNLQGNTAFNGTTTGAAAIGQNNPFCNVFDSCGVTCPNDTSYDVKKCIEESLVLTARPGFSYSWSPATGLSSATVQNPVCTATGNITYTVTIVGTDSCVYQDEINVEVSDCHCEDSCNWSLTGNSFVRPWYYLGSRNDADIFFRRNNVQAGRIGTSNTSFGLRALKPAVTGTDNTAIGVDALAANTTGVNNTAVGSQSLKVSTSGHQNSAFGYAALFANTSGPNNTAIGYTAMAANTIGYNNSALGFGALSVNINGYENAATGMEALKNNTSGYLNVATGSRALFTNQTGSLNTASGAEAMHDNISGHYNAATGYQSLFKNTNGSGNTANGYQSLYNNTSGGYNTAMGFAALFTNTTGGENTAVGFWALNANTSGYNNVATGAHALQLNTSGADNTATGFEALYLNLSGTENAAFGTQALRNNTTGIYNSGLGHRALYGNTTGQFNIGIGGFSLNANSTGYNNIALGFNSLAANTASNNIGIGRGAGSDITTGIDNTFLGHRTGLGIITGDANTIIGANVTISSSALSNTIILADGAGTQRLFIDNNGFAGLGTQSPTAALHVDCAGTVAMPNPSNVRFENLPDGDGEILVVDGAGYVFRKKGSHGFAQNNSDRQIEALKLQVTELQQQVKMLMEMKTAAQGSDGNSLEVIPTPFTDKAKVVYSIAGFKSSAMLQVVNSNGVVLRTYPVSKANGVIELGNIAISSSVVIFNIIMDGKTVISKRSVKI